MEFFERAHVRKDKQSTKKGSKSGEAVKKQLKQMLYGYKESDIELIKNSTNVINDVEDSTSVSGFSDLNLTNSSNEGNRNEETSGFNADNESISDLSLSESSVQSSSTKTNSDPDISESESLHSVQSISELNDDIQSLSEEMAIRNNEDKSSSTSKDDLSFVNLDTTTENESEDTQPFDADGYLAAKILEKLHKNQENDTVHEKSKKRKLDKDLNNMQNLDMDIHQDKRSDYREYQKRKNKLIKNDIQDTDKESVENEESIISDGDTFEINSANNSICSSPPYESVTAMKMQNQSFNEILGDYKHSTVKNLPSENQHDIFSTNNSGMFSTESMNVHEILLDEAKDDLELELDNDQTTDVFDVDSPEPDISSQTPEPEISSQSPEPDISSQTPIDDSTIFFNDTMQSDQLSGVESSTEPINVPLESPVRIFNGKNNCILVLKHPVEIFIHGKVKVIALGGKVEIFGYTLKDKPCEIYAPNYSHAQCLKTVEHQNLYYGLFSKLTSKGLSVAESEEIVTTIGHHDAVVSLHSLRNSTMEFVEHNFTVADLFSKQTRYVDYSFKEASTILGCSLCSVRPFRCFQELPIWKQVLRCVYSKPSRGIVCGGKGSGKSTFLRYYVNKLLAQGPVLVIDLDPGQCEFTVAGNISVTVVTEPLLGPNFTHLKRPDRMLNIGIINTMDNVKRYANAVTSLIYYCYTKEQFQDMPWIVNTMGMTNAVGLKFMALIILITKPTFLLQIDSRNAKKRYECHLDPQTVRQLYYEKYQNNSMFRDVVLPDYLDYSFFVSDQESTVKSPSSLAPRDERYLNFLSYFSGIQNVSNLGLLDITPYEVNLNELNIGLNVRINKDAVIKVINGKIVALCEHTISQRTSKVFTMGDKPLLCHGHGLIRGIDRGVLYLITPLPPKELSLVNTIVYADWVPELIGQEEHLPTNTPVPYRTASVYQQRQLMTAPRRRFNPVQLLKMTRNT